MGVILLMGQLVVVRDVLCDEEFWYVLDSGDRHSVYLGLCVVIP